ADVQGDLPAARALLQDALESARAAGARSLVLEIVAQLAELASRGGFELEALDLIRDTAARAHEVEDEAAVGWTTLLLARHEIGGDPIVGRMHLRDALERLRSRAHPGRLATCFEFCAEVAAASGDDETAIRLLAFASSLRRAHKVAGTTNERRRAMELRAILERRMERSARERGEREGRALALDAALHRALGEFTPLADAMVPA
ncbi:MAG: hypothetical protein JO359_15005, partial [Candidatus Eremiobacteraeota bacterium]|nr:hypothetical protein [Candidatus Eremiobacteraeota bacterium]